MLKYILVLAILIGVLVSPVAPVTSFPGPEADFIIGPQVPIGTSWFDRTQIERARVHGAQCPTAPPTDPDALNSFVLLNYYDLPLTLAIAYKRTGDPVFLTYFRKCADAWWLHPQWIQAGAQRDFDNGQGPPPRHAGIGGLILRAIDGRPEMWDWITTYTRHQFNLWLKRRVNDPALYYGVREGAFILHAAAWVAATHPDPAVRAEFLADAESISVNYFGRLQYPDGSWRWNTYPDEFLDTDGGTLQGITQPFMVGLLLNALIDVHRISTNESVRASIQGQLTRSCYSLFNHSYRRFEPTGLPGVNWRSFWYFDHGGTSVNPTRYEHGGGSYTAADIPREGTWVISSERQSISTVFSAYAYAYLITGDPALKAMGDELFDAAFSGSDGFRGFAADTAKNYNQTYRMGGRYLGWLTGTSQPLPSPTPSPVPSPSASPSANPTPNVDRTAPTASITSPLSGAVLSNTVTVTASASDNVAIDTVYLIVDGVVVAGDSTEPYTFSLNTLNLSEGGHSTHVRAWDRSGNAGDSQRVGFIVSNSTPTPSPTPTPGASPTPAPSPSPTPTPLPSPSPSPTLAPTPQCVKWNPNKKCLKWK